MNLTEIDEQIAKLLSERDALIAKANEEAHKREAEELEALQTKVDVLKKRYDDAVKAMNEADVEYRNAYSELYTKRNGKSVSIFDSLLDDYFDRFLF